jgi:DNA (cytosine-5)-methyltransferase 1
LTHKSILSLFSGCGGLDLGFVQAGFHIKLAFDNWGPAVETHRQNSKLLGGEVFQRSLALADREIQVDELPRCEVILGGPPCQGFSFAGRQFLDDPRNQLYRDFVRIVSHLRPKAFLLENVLGMEAMALDQAIRAFEECDYVVTPNRVLATDFGVAQRRERLFIVGFRKDLCIRFSPPSATYGELFGTPGDRSILDAIKGLPAPIAMTDGAMDLLTRLPKYLQSHAYRPLPDSVQKFVRHIPNGGYFRDAPMRTLPERLRKIARDPGRYRSPRLFPKPDPDEPAQTVPADTNPSLGGVLAPDLEYRKGAAIPVVTLQHTKGTVYSSPQPSRRITPREAARLQSFPDEFLFSGSLTTQFRLIGNAVPVRAAKAFAERILEHLEHGDPKAKSLAARTA